MISKLLKYSQQKCCKTVVTFRVSYWNFQSSRGFSKDMEPDYEVKSDMAADPSNVYVPILRDSTKQELYKLHKLDPNLWTIPKLSQKFGTSLERTKAVLFLMERREKMMIEEKVLEISPLWQEIYEKHNLDAKKYTHEALATEYSLDQNEIKTIINRLSVHQDRLNLVTQNEDFWNEAIRELEDQGVDTRFRETPSSNGKRQDESIPELFGDDEYEEAKLRLKRRIQRETRAGAIKASLEQSPLHEIFNKFDGIEEKSTDISDDISKEEEDTKINMKELRQKTFDEYYATILIPQARNRPVNESSNIDDLSSIHFCRWKFAFRDLSHGNVRGNMGLEGSLNRKQRRNLQRNGSELPATHVPTLICTRDGRLRAATALEESGRSWGRHPRYLDLVRHQGSPEFQAMVDFDKDEHKVKAKIAEKRARREALKKQLSST